MAGDWIKMEYTTLDKPEVALMSSILKIDPENVFAKLFRVWVWADSISVSGERLTVTEGFIDTVARRKGFAAAMRKAGWLEGENGALSFPNFSRHNGESAKQRALANRRIANWRERHKDNDNVTPPALQKHHARNGNVTPPALQKRIPEKEYRVHTPISPLSKGDVTHTSLSPPEQRLRKLWHMRDTTPLDRSETKAWEKGKAAVAATSEEQWKLLDWWLSADPEVVPDAKFRRQDMATHLNNWNAELLRAGAAAKKHEVEFGEKKEKPPDFPADWKDRIERESPEYNCPRNFHDVPESVQRWVLDDWRKNP